MGQTGGVAAVSVQVIATLSSNVHRLRIQQVGHIAQLS
jgi:uncharacterized membrane protein